MESCPSMSVWQIKLLRQIDVIALWKLMCVGRHPVDCPEPNCQSSSLQETACLAWSKRPLNGRAAGAELCEGNWMWLLRVLTPSSPANLCRGRSRLPRCSSGCGGKSPGIQVTGWCQSYRGCNLRTALLDETQPFGDEKKNERGKEPKINNAASEHGKICLLVSDAVKYWDIGGVVKNQYKTFSINPFIDEGKWKQQNLKASWHI